MLLAIDWQNLNRFWHGSRSGSVGDRRQRRRRGAEVFLALRGLQCLPLKKTAKAAGGGWVNMVALGLAGTLGLPAAALEEACAPV